MITSDHIGQHFLVSVSDVRRRVRVIDRRGDEKRLWHFAITSLAAVCGCRKQGQAPARRLLRLSPTNPMCPSKGSFFSGFHDGRERGWFNEQMSQNRIFDPDGRDLHSRFRRRQA